jgi:hypothetical protein
VRSASAKREEHGERLSTDDRTISKRELLLTTAAAGLLAAVMHWPLPLHLGRDIPRDTQAPLVQAWQVAWDGHALAHQPLHFFQANIYWPLRNSLAFSDALIGYAPAGLIGAGPKAALVRYDLLFLFAYALAFLGPYLLARELGSGRAGATVAGAAFAYAPWRLEQDGHLHVLSSGGIPLSLFLLLRGYRRSRPGLILGGWLVAAWQLLLGFTLGLQLAYLLAALALVAGLVWIGRRRPPLGRPVIAATLAGVAVFGIATALLARPYVQVARDHPEARRSEALVASLSPPLSSYFAAPPGNLIWGRPTASVRRRLSFVPEQTLFPGILVLALAGWGVMARVYPRRLRVGLVVGGIACAILALGIDNEGVRLPLQPYRLLYHYAPGWDSVRTPSRINTLTSLALALLAGAGAHAALGVVGGRAPRRTTVSRQLVGGLLVGVVLLEGAGFGIGGRGGLISGPPHPSVPLPPAGQRHAAAPQLHLPLLTTAVNQFVFWSTDRFPKIVNGRASFEPRETVTVYRRTLGFPDRSSVRWLRATGVRTVILHPSLAGGTPWQAAQNKSVQGLPLRREVRGAVVVFDVGAH